MFRKFFYNNCLVSIDREWSTRADSTIKLIFTYGSFTLEYSGSEQYIRENFKGALERFAEKVAKDFDEYFYCLDQHADCFEAMISDFETVECPYWTGDIDDSDDY